MAKHTVHVSQGDLPLVVREAAGVCGCIALESVPIERLPVEDFLPMGVADAGHSGRVFGVGVGDGMLDCE